MSDRLDQIAAFLENAGWLGARRTPIAGDLSTRCYSHLVMGGRTAVLMVADSTMEPFARMTEWLRHNGFSAPEIIAGEPEAGLLLLEDFGDISVNRHLTQAPDQTDNIHAGCIDLLLALRGAKAPALSCPDADTLVAWTELADTQYPGVRSERLAGFREVLRSTLNEVLRSGVSLSLRDFHADNLMWLPERNGLNRFGLLDFQDAFLTHPVYDLMSFLADARVDIPAERRETTLQAYIDRSGDDPVAFRRAFAAFSAQRNLRILGIFAKGASEGRSHHLNKLPRVNGYLVEALNHDMFADVRSETLSALPDPNVALKELGG